MNRQKMIISPRGVIEDEVAVTAGNDVGFDWETDVNGLALPVGFTVKGIDVIPHDGGDPEAAVSTIWRLRLYKRSGNGVKDMIYEDTRYGESSSNAPSFDKTPWQWENLDKKGIVHGTIGIKTAATNCSFSIALSFERW